MKLPPLASFRDQAVLMASPSRLYSDAFWSALPWKRITAELGCVRVIELGCGSGSRFRLLSGLLGDALGEYLGVDIVRHASWDEIARTDPRARFIEADAEDLPKDMLAKFNLVVSQSVLEHLAKDMKFFTSYRDALTSGRPALQVHLVPAAASLCLALLHGYRQYSRGTIGRIASLYAGTRCCVVPLGGLQSNVLHFVAITVPILLRVPSMSRRPSSAYRFLLQGCYTSERRLNSLVPSFYAFTLETGMRRPLLSESIAEG